MFRTLGVAAVTFIAGIGVGLATDAGADQPRPTTTVATKTPVSCLLALESAWKTINRRQRGSTTRQSSTPPTWSACRPAEIGWADPTDELGPVVALGGDLTVQVGERPAQRVGLAAQGPGVGQFGGVVGHAGPGGVGIDDLELGSELRTALQQGGEIRSTATKEAHSAGHPTGPPDAEAAVGKRRPIRPPGRNHTPVSETLASCWGNVGSGPSSRGRCSLGHRRVAATATGRVGAFSASRGSTRCGAEGDIPGRGDADDAPEWPGPATFRPGRYRRLGPTLVAHALANILATVALIV